MKITYDASVDAAYIYISDKSDKIEGKQVEFTFSCDSPTIPGMINIDFTKEGKIFGIECIPGSILLDKELIINAIKL